MRPPCTEAPPNKALQPTSLSVGFGRPLALAAERRYVRRKADRVSGQALRMKEGGSDDLLSADGAPPNVEPEAGRIAAVIARYWLTENPYCGLSVPMIAERIPEIDPALVEKEVVGMETKGDVSTRMVGEDRWVYPRETLMSRFDDSEEAKVGRYAKMARLGGSQVLMLFFQRAVLDRYRDDPRFRFDDDGVHGYIGIKDKYYFDAATPESDKVSIRFGGAYAQNGERVVTCILKDLDGLALAQQQHWASYELQGAHALDADYYAGAFEGQWTNRVSIFRALVQELVEVNKICLLSADPPLFRADHDGEPPHGLVWMTKPTRYAFHDFALLLDKILSENLNKDFFRGKVELVDEQNLGDGKVRIVDRSTIALLDAYLRRYGRPADEDFIATVTSAFRKVRKLRQAPAHRLGDDAYDPAILKEQQRIVDEVYGALRGLRLLLSNHPKAKSYTPPDWLQEGRIG